jgi:cytochrome c oxidase cbb3-type subunit 2/cytochrome c oxidase cbb3-type subunit I/II
VLHAASISIMVLFPLFTIENKPSDIWVPMTRLEREGMKIYVSNGCSYCHSLFIRPQDWGHGAIRIAQPGDYYGQEPAILGTERTGPDLSQEGGIRSDDWHIAHFFNPRRTSPVSLMPDWEFLGSDKIKKLIAYVQYLGGNQAKERMNRQIFWKQKAKDAYKMGIDSNIHWIHSMVPKEWQNLPNPYPATEEAFARGRHIYQQFCINCHGPIGDGNGSAEPYLNPPPLNFTALRRNLINGKYIGGILYYQIMNGITGTAMPFFKNALESEKIWDVSNFIAVAFIGYTDADIQPKGIDASIEQEWINYFEPPNSSDSSKESVK